MTIKAKAGKPGRKAVDGATGVVRTTVTFLPHHIEQLPLLGGSAFLRQKVDEAWAALPAREKVLKKRTALKVRSG